MVNLYGNDWPAQLNRLNYRLSVYFTVVLQKKCGLVVFHRIYALWYGKVAFYIRPYNRLCLKKMSTLENPRGL